MSAGEAPVALIVDDNEANLKLIEVTLRVDGFETERAGTGAEAIAALESRGPDVVLLDLGLPDIDGVELVGRIRANPAWAAVPVIAVSASARPDDVERALAAGCDAFIPKPVDTRELTGRVRATIRERGERER